MSGLRWDDRVRKKGFLNRIGARSEDTVDKKTQETAKHYCQSIGARLPTMKEFEELYRNNPQTVVLNLNHRFWTSTDGTVIDGKTGTFQIHLATKKFTVRCVLDPAQ